MSLRGQHIKQQLKLIDGNDPKSNRIKHKKMCTSPFVFYRGSAQLFYSDLYSGALSTPECFQDIPLTSIMGDCHTSNFGFYTNEGSKGDQVVFSINDFDDACIGLSYWDILRYLVSVFLTAEHGRGALNGEYQTDKDVTGKSGINKTQVYAVAEAFIDSYLDILRKTKDSNDKDIEPRWMSRLQGPSPLKKRYKKAQKVVIGGELFLEKSALAKAVDLSSNPPCFYNDRDKFSHKGFDKKKLIEHFRPYFYDQIVDAVVRINSGTGSVNMQRYYLLLAPFLDGKEPNIADYHLAEVKQQRKAAPLHFFNHLHPQNQLNSAHLTVKCQQLMQSTKDHCLDDTFYDGHNWLIRSRHHAKVGFDPEHLALGKADKVKDGFANYVSACAEELAQAHLRCHIQQDYFVEKSILALEASKDLLLQISQDYGEQVVSDWRWLRSQQI